MASVKRHWSIEWTDVDGELNVTHAWSTEEEVSDVLKKLKAAHVCVEAHDLSPPGRESIQSAEKLPDIDTLTRESRSV